MAALLEEGSIFAGDFRVRRPLRAGGMGAVYVVEQLSTGMPRALKLMRPELVADPSLRRRFEQEAQVAARIASEHVVSVLAAGVDGPTGMPWLVMELLDGEDLATLLAREGALPAARVAAIFEQLCHAVGAAHAAGIVHRDLKPDNVFVARANRAGASFTVKVLDFGIAKIVAEAKTTHTDAMGTPLWMAPEQTERGGAIGPATDVWALGLMAFHALTGRHYWLSADDPSASVTALMREIVLDPLAPASARAAAYGRADRLPAGFDAWFARAVAREPRARLPDAAAAMRELDPVLRGGPALAPTVHGGAPLAPAPLPAPPLGRPGGTELAGPAPNAPAPPLAKPPSWGVRIAAIVASTAALIAMGVVSQALERGCAGKVCALEVNDCLAHCDKGNAPSCRYLGEMYERGEHGAPKSPEQARRAYERGCDRRSRES